ncbi:serine/threonine-protein phosphatase 4 regulatory subunit 4 [Strigomonas culicis]|uniref:Serine/threonine-protein phosphatase 4 regulatory subunit 4 n=1 Tax=Strigomonas culicis TaxID=28005 RepID=S9U9M9_9TRYP|nr:serine/threonine-protein phosphatase 4 regulatory subunit 4 [Strigomonas culicis]|eukprot:EPY27467.1 serine/threonine-protein phosphatase 4 regulatory subunit 4 [Strigomonas culicis]
MDYRSPFEIRKQFLEDSRAAHSPVKRPKHASSDFPNVPKPSGSVNLNLSSLPDDPTALVREVPGEENLKALDASRKRDEAVQQYIEKQNLTLEDSAKYIMEKGSTAQRISFFNHVRDRLVDRNAKTVSSILHILLDSMWAQDPELQCRAPQDIQSFLGLLNFAAFEDLFEVTTTMLMVKTVSVREAWGKLLLSLMAFLNIDQLLEKLVPLALQKSEHAEFQDQRELSCAILGGMCQYLPVNKIEDTVLPRALALCQDTNVGVRQSICQHLGIISRALGVEKAKTRVAPDLFELLNDEERTVSRTAFSCLLDLVEFFGPQYRKEKLYPIIKNYISNPPSEVVSLLIGEFGRFLDEIKGDIGTEEDVNLFAEFFCAAVNKEDEDARVHCAYNFPAVCISLPHSKFPTYLLPCLLKLANDPNVRVKRSIAAGIHELVPILGDKAAVYLEEPVQNLITSKEREVLNVLFEKSLKKLLDCFGVQLSGPSRTSCFEGIAKGLQQSLQFGTTYWYNVKHYIFFVDRYQSFYALTTVCDNFIPSLLAYLKVGANILKDDCASLVAQLLVLTVIKPTTCVQLMNRITSEFGRGASCYLRQCYLRIVRELCKRFSRRFVRERLLECCIELQRDPVPCVRLSLARVLPLLYKGLRLTNPGTFEEEYNNMLQRLQTDKEAEVRDAARVSKEEVDKTERENRREDHRD